MRAATGALAALLLAACGDREQPPAGNANQSAGQTLDWVLREEGRGAALVLAEAKGGAEMRLICTGRGELLVNVAGFRPVGSEERMTFGQSGTVETLVADPSGDGARGGVTAAGPVPQNLDALISGPVAANYGAQDSGPHPPVPADLVSRFVNACRSPAAAQQAQTGGEPGNGKVSECLIQDGERIPEMALHAIGTEPFWAADVNGRCVSYSTPENIDGTRIWTEFGGSRDSGVWEGYYENQRFVMRTEPEPGCSDGMSDKRYPIKVTLTVGGEERRGCAEYR